MFTGIVQAVGAIVAANTAADGVRLRVDAGLLDTSDVAIGDSIAVAGCCLTALAFITMGHASPSQITWEYKIVNDVTDSEAAKLAADGWEYAGYLGEGTKGSSNDETLWKRPAK